MRKADPAADRLHPQGRMGRRAVFPAGPVRVELRIAAPSAAHAARVLLAAARSWARPGEMLSLSLVTAREIRRLNRAWRRKDSATDVLSWPEHDVVISLDAARRQAREGGWPLKVELRRLLAHGLLHCRGYDHEDPRAAQRMAAAERRLLGASGMVGDAQAARPGKNARGPARRPRRK